MLTKSPSDALVESGTNVTLNCLSVSSFSSENTTYQFMNNGTLKSSQVSGAYTFVASTTDSFIWTCMATMKSIVSSESNPLIVAVIGK